MQRTLIIEGSDTTKMPQSTIAGNIILTKIICPANNRKPAKLMKPVLKIT